LASVKGRGLKGRGGGGVSGGAKRERGDTGQKKIHIVVDWCLGGKTRLGGRGGLKRTGKLREEKKKKPLFSLGRNS